MNRIGPKMTAAVNFVARHDAPVPRRKVAHYVSPSPRPSACESYGYAIVDRCVRAGLLVLVPDPRCKAWSCVALPGVAECQAEIERLRVHCRRLNASLPENEQCDECDGTGRFFIDREPRACICTEAQ